MDNPESEKSSAPEEGSALNRNRSFKSKQLVRSQAIRESQSPPRTVSPAVNDVVDDARADDVVEEKEKRRPVEIQITGGSWDNLEQRARRRWPVQRDLLSNAPRVACVAGCRHEQRCRGQRGRHPCPIKQDSGISCPDDCMDCSDFEPSASKNEVRKACSLDSDDSYCRCPDRRDKPKNNMLSRTESDTDKYEPTGPELVNFIKETLNKNPRDRMALLKIEKELHSLVTDTGRCIVKFPVMTSYGRMLVHRVATLFQLSHHLDQSSKNSVTVSKSGTCGGRIPCTGFKQWCTVNFPPSPVRIPDAGNAKSILKRDTHSPDESGASCRAVERSKSLEQREKDYERVRRRIFSSDNCTQDESQWPWLSAGPVKLLTPDSGRNKLLKVQSLEGSGPAWRARGAVSKSHSFGGVGAEPPPRLLSRQGDLASSSWRLSPSSSGYKTLSLRSTDSVTPSPTGGASPEPTAEGALVWAVTDLSSVPPGALVIHPQTGRPLTNPDGSVYHFDPSNPPVIYDANAYMQDQKIQNCEKRRGRLEKQHSFIDAEAESRCEDGLSKCCCECRRHEGCSRASNEKIQNCEKRRGRLEKQHSFIDAEAESRCEDGLSKCCCECRRHEGCSRASNEKLSTQTQQKTIPVPASPVKNRYEQNAEQPANQNAEQANHRAPYEAPANQRPEPTNQRSELSNDAQVFEPATSQMAFEKQIPEFEPANQRYESPNQRTFENRPYAASPHHRPQSYDALANQRAVNENVANQVAPMNKLTSQETVEMSQYVTQQSYSKSFRNDEVTSPQVMQNHTILQPDGSMYNVMPTKLGQVSVMDPNLRPVSLTNMMFPSHMAQGYQYVNQVRMDQPLQPVYQQVMQEEQKITTSQVSNDTTFRIDPSYPYAPLQYGAACATCAGACLDPSGQHQRGYNVGYAPLEQQVLQQPFPVSNVLLQHNLQHYPYQEMQWGSGVPVGGAPPKLLMQELCPVYQQYPYVYPQMIPQPYPLVQPVYPLLDKRARRGSAAGSHRATPLDAHERRDGEIALRIQQIKDQMAQLNTQEKEKSGNGLLGSAPVNNFNGRLGRPMNDETQLSSAARAIVNSIRNMQANTYPHSARQLDPRERRRDDRDDKRRAPHPRQLSPSNWYRRSPGPVHPALNHPRRPHPDTRNGRR